MFDEDDYDPGKLQRLTWIVDGRTHSIEANEDRIDVLVGQLMTSYWDPQGGWSIKYKIEDVK